MDAIDVAREAKAREKLLAALEDWPNLPVKFFIDADTALDVDLWAVGRMYDARVTEIVKGTDSRCLSDEYVYELRDALDEVEEDEDLTDKERMLERERLKKAAKSCILVRIEADWDC